MLIDFREFNSEIPPITTGDNPISRVKSYKLLGLWLDGGWVANPEYITKS